MTAWYNEPDPFAAQWLRNLIAAGHIAPGIVDERKIQDVEAWELHQFTQCHFFAGIGVWSYALRQAGWSDDRPIWTGSCPCQPFSAAGKQKGFADERHMWPTWFELIDQCRPSTIVGEQVASKDGLQWLDLVSTDMEGAGYAFGASDLCAAGFGQAHLRQRLYFVAISDGVCAIGLGDSSEQSGERDSREIHGAQTDGAGSRDTDGRHDLGRSDASAAIGLAHHHHHEGLEGWAGMLERADQCALGASSLVVRLADNDDQQLDRSGNIGQGRRIELAIGSEFVGLADSSSRDASAEREQSGRQHGLQPSDDISSAGTVRNSREAGSLDDADWLLCRNPAGEPSWRPVESLTFPLAHGIAGRVGILRAYGNALDAKTAQAFAEVVKEICDEAGV